MSTPAFNLKFTYNWNHKLDCDCFTTLRLHNAARDHVGTRVQILLKDEDKGTGTIKGVRRFFLHEINEFVARLDTGYSADECRQLIRTMYPKVDFTVTQITLLLIVKDKPPKHETNKDPQGKLL